MSIQIELDNISHLYGGKPVLRDCSLKIAPGITAIMGHNGSGKSTLLRLCALLENPSKGSVSCLDPTGAHIPQNTELKRRITLVLAKGGLFNESALRNVTYGLKVRGMGKKERREKGMLALEAVGLQKLHRQNALTLSSGEAQRLALARALAIEPDVLFLDEPTASVDEENTEIIEELIIKLNIGEPDSPHIPSIVFTTHDTDQSIRLATQTIRMSKGTIVSA
jgi:tungstate transport system ATP-binding protein